MVARDKERLSLDVIGHLEEQLEQNPLDHAQWTKLIDQVIIKDKEEQVRSTFDRYFAIFKFDARQWGTYINFELNRGDFSRVEKLFARCLPITTDVELCRTYVLYVRRVNDVITGGEKARSTVVLAFDFAVNKVGVDIDSFDLWSDYLDFFKSWTPGSSWEQQQKTDLIRKLYRRCLVIPTSKIESIWSEYTRWENEVSTPNSASKFIADLSTAYMEARSWNTEWHNVTKNSIRRRLLAASPLLDSAEIINEQVALWYLWIDLEKKNSLNLKDFELHNRIGYVYKRAVSLLPFVPEMWFRYNQFLLLQNDDPSRAARADLLSDGLKLNPGSFLLTFELAEIHEKDGAFPKAQQVFENLIKHMTTKHGELEAEVQAIKEKARAKTEPKKLQEPADDKMKGESDDEDVAEQPIVQYTEAEALRILNLESQLQELSKAVTLVYIKFMAMCKRSQGIKEVRAVFKQRKNFKSMGYELYVENALIEFYSDNKKTADKIFDLAIKSFGKTGGFLYEYLEYLILTNAIDSLKVFFEVAVTSLLKEISADKEVLQTATTNILEQRKRLETLHENEHYLKKMVKRYMCFAARFLDLDTVLSLQKRYLQYFPDDDDMALFADRYRVEGLDAIAKYDLGDKAAFQGDEEEVKETSLKKRRKVKEDNYSPESTGAATVVNGSVNMPQKPLQAQTQQRGFVGQTIYGMLQALPNAGYFGPPPEHVFNSAKLVEMFANLPSLPGEI